MMFIWSCLIEIVRWNERERMEKYTYIGKPGVTWSGHQVFPIESN